MKTIKIAQADGRSAGFSLVELTVAVVVIALIAALGFNIASGVQDATRIAKLEKDVRTLNTATTLYVASGGSLIGSTLPQDVLNKMKTVASARTESTVVALQGRFVDPRIRAVMADGEADGKARAVWNTRKARFEIGTTGIGAKEFALDSVVSIETEDRDTALAYSSESKWVWDYTDTAATRQGPTDRVVTADLKPPQPTGVGAGSPTQLPAPTFSIPGGIYSINAFPMSLTLSIPSEHILHGNILYQLDDGAWAVYTGAVSVPRGIATKVNAFVASNDPDNYSDSPVTFEVYEAQFDSFSGSADGTFGNANGPQNMDVEFLQDSHQFEWGTEFTPGGFTNPNQMTFVGSSFSDVEPEQEFLLGSLTYFNGTTFMNTTADTVELEVVLDLELLDVQEVLTFQLDLESTQNLAWQTEDENADFVRLSNIQTSFATVLNGVTYYLSLRFGEHTENGFTTIDEFHVHENATASGNVYGTLTATPPAP